MKMQKIQIGFQIVKESINYAKKVKGFYLFPLMSAICILISMIGFAGLSYIYAGCDLDLIYKNLENYSGMSFLSINILLFTFVALFLSIFFNVAFLGSLRLYSENKTGSFSQGISFALSKIKPIFFWACFSFFVGNIIAYIFRPLTEKFPAVSTITQSLLNVAWGVGTYFVLPIIVFEPHSSIREIVKKSARLMKEKLPEQISARTYIGVLYSAISFILCLIFAASLFLAFFAWVSTTSLFLLVTGIISVILSFFLLIFGMIFLTVTTSVTQLIVNFALYQYANKGAFPEEFKGSNMILEKA